MSNEAITDRGPRSRLQCRVAAAADALLAQGTSVAPVDVLRGSAGCRPAWPTPGGCTSLEQLAPVSPDKLAAALQHCAGWAVDTGLVPSEVTYLAATPTGALLRFTADGDQVTERAWRTLDAIRPVGGDPPARDQGAAQGAGPGRHRAAQPVDLRRLRRLGFAAVHGGWPATVHGLRELTTWCSCPPATPP